MLATFAAVLVGGLLVAGDDSSKGGAESPTAPVSRGGARGSSATKVGAPFPGFRLREASGRTLTPRSLEGKPAIVWFTTAYCIPCQVGAKAVAELDDDLGGKRFNVLVVFVDTSESADDLRLWRDNFASEDWLVALDEENGLARRVRLRVLDTKYLLDSRGVITDVDLEIADDEYLDRVRKLAEAEG